MNRQELSGCHLTLWNQFTRKITPAHILALSFLTLILFGSGLLYLPASHHGSLSLLDAVFTATLAVCVTGLIVVDTGLKFTFFGVVFPERDEAYRVARTLESEYLLDNITLGEGISIIETAPPQSWVGKSLGELNLRNQYGVLVLIIKEVISSNVLLIPTADHVIKDSESLVILGNDQDLAKLSKLR
ncbi:hypothetical protein GF406_03895 [candidate division KSB1 bacterium]|nr:hypothetical protein [candidate division KSB1 bacterium]